MNELLIKDDIKIENMIYEVRGKQIMLDRDVAKLYLVETRRINEVVKRNKDRFPSDFCFQLTKAEWNILRSQIAISSNNNFIHGGIRYLPYVFTEHGVMMLSGLLKNIVAIKINIDIINAFVKMRKYIPNTVIQQEYYNKMIIKHDNEIKLLQESLNKLSNKEKNNHIFFKGQIYDAYSLMIDIFNTSKESILIIDNYVDKSLLDILSKTDKFITIITNKYNNEDLEKYKKQYKNVEIKISNSFHDRFIIIDNKYLYHSGASFKDLGKKCFSINKIEDSDYLMELIKKIV